MDGGWKCWNDTTCNLSCFASSFSQAFHQQLLNTNCLIYWKFEPILLIDSHLEIISERGFPNVFFVCQQIRTEIHTLRQIHMKYSHEIQIWNTVTQLLQGSYGHSSSGVGGEKSGEIYHSWGTRSHQQQKTRKNRQN